MALAVGSRLGPYEIVAPLGAGGMGEVYRARDTRLKRDVAIKILPESFASDPDRLARFQREAEVLASLNHPNIAGIYGLEDADGTRALVMELVEGETLADRIAHGPIPIDEALPIAKQIADALEAAHARGIIHRDLKPANVKLGSNGTVKVLDFGLAKLNEHNATSMPNVPNTLSMSPTITSPALMTGVGVLLGTAAYMSPEQAKGRPADKRSDVWAFGCVLYEMVTGQRAFDGADIAEVLGAVVRLEPNWTLLASLPAPLVTLIRRCLVKDPNARVADASTVRYVIDDVTLSAPDATVPVSARTRLSWTIAALCLAVFAASTVVAIKHLIEQTPEAMPVQFDVTPPESSTFAGSVPASAMSPDGRLLAFIATSNGKPMLWVRSLANASAQPLAGTEGAMDSFWSPDSQWLGFFTPTQLKKVSAAGGPVIALTDSTGVVGGTWSKDNVIVVAGGGATPIWRIPASGGAKTWLSSVDKARGETGYRYPSFLPDGRHYLFLVTRGSQREVRVASLDDAEVRTVLTDASRTLYASGHLLFSRAGVLMAAPFDANARQVTGEPFPIADHVAESASAGYAPFSVSDNGIASFAHAGGDTIQLTWKDRSGSTLGTVGDAADYRDLSAFGPDGRVVLSRTTNSNRDVWVIDPGRSTAARVTFGSATEANPAWSPDGKRIAFSGGAAGGELYEKSADGIGDERLLAKIDGTGAVNDWSSDGRFIAYRADVAQTKADVWIVPTDGKTKPFPLVKTQYDEDNATFSPNVRWIAYESDESGEKQVYVQPFPPTGAKYQISRNGGSRPRWGGDGRGIFFIGPDGSMMTVRVNNDRPYEAETPVRLFDSGIAIESGRARMYAVTPDGNRFLLAIPRQRSTPTPITVMVNWPEATRPRNTAR